MNPHEHDHQPQPDPETRQAPTAENTGAPEAIEAADVTRNRGHETPEQEMTGRRARGVDWVRPSDLLARGTGRMSRAAIDFNTHLSEQSRTGLIHGATWAGAQARKLPHPSAFGYGRDRTGADRSPVGMQ
ncbi:hypothetical protein [Brachybacterium tyrofermentans]|uniref:hypothetical protein n=1 Tax=Brachybacterium tyrofermentans TaxID=47848 RepID=UPI003FD1997E